MNQTNERTRQTNKETDRQTTHTREIKTKQYRKKTTADYNSDIF